MKKFVWIAYDLIAGAVLLYFSTCHPVSWYRKVAIVIGLLCVCVGLHSLVQVICSNRKGESK